MTLEEAATELNIVSTNFSQACSTRYSKYLEPNYQFNMDLYQQDVNQIIKEINYLHYLYYPMIHLFGSEHQLAKHLSKITGRSTATWAVYLSKTLFARSDTIRLKLSPMAQELSWIASCIFIEAVSKNQLSEQDWI